MKIITAAVSVATFVAAIPASAQQGSAPAAAPLGGTAIPGLCMLSREAIFINAAVGKAATARLQQLAGDAQAEVAAERKPLDADLQAFQAEVAKLTPAQRSQREQMLQPRLRAVQAKAQLRGREIEATREKAMATIADYAQPVIAQVYTQRKCGLLVDRNSVLGGNLANDLTADVVRGLDAKVTTISFNRETLPVQPAAKP
ncbi:OmpH family outer membrane protein [Sphingomonas sp. QA11]|uniref:OmpH family outer membrane protein n=1 Tax=Sphingomonas sp. QA11 TaxID=2950605 RepID=UPI00234B28FF|nr:OmpH family outer membrane protein [Sphingomonas sp. QA11]WCM25945.1 OmpH family outer membrane protein [Sphingomonas sp. QA11]